MIKLVICLCYMRQGNRERDDGRVKTLTTHSMVYMGQCQNTYRHIPFYFPTVPKFLLSSSGANKSQEMCPKIFPKICMSRRSLNFPSKQSLINHTVCSHPLKGHPLYTRLTKKSIVMNRTVFSLAKFFFWPMKRQHNS